MHEKTVLLVEDDRDSREIYGAVLRHGGSGWWKRRTGERGFGSPRGTGPT